MAVHKQCVLYDRECIGCGECDRCDLDPDKICDNCMKCVRGNEERECDEGSEARRQCRGDHGCVP